MKRNIAIIDIGTSKIKIILSKISLLDIDIVSVDSFESKGIKEGYISDLTSLKKVVYDNFIKIKHKNKFSPEFLFFNLSGHGIEGVDYTGMCVVKNRNITQSDILNALACARESAIIEGDNVIHSLPQEFIVDKQKGIEQPLGMSGRLLQVRSHIVMGDSQNIDNIKEVSSILNSKSCSIVSNPLSIGYSCLTSDEKEIGVMGIDIGGGVSDVVVFHDNKIKTSFSIRFGGEIIDKVLSSEFSLTTCEAKRIKEGIHKNSDDHVVCSREGYNDILFSKKEIINSINNTLSMFIEREMKTRLKPQMRSEIKSIVITGGTSNLKEINDIFEDSFGVHCRTGHPLFKKQMPIKKLTMAEMSCALGILRFAASNIPEVSKKREIAYKITSGIKDFFSEI